MRCSVCGALSEHNVAVCPHCGHTFISARDDLATPAQSDRTPSALPSAHALPDEYAAALRSPTPPWSAVAPAPLAPPSAQTQRRRARSGAPLYALRTLLNRQTALIVALLALVVGGLLFTFANHPVGGGIALLPPAATATPLRTASGEILLYHDALNASTHGWENQDGCRFHDGGLQVKDGFACFVPLATRNDMHVAVTVKQTAGPTDHWYGIGIRSTYDEDSGYYIGYNFALSNDGYWGFHKCTKDTHVCIPLVRKLAGSVMHVGLNQSNTIEISAKGSHFDFWINGTHVGSFDDTTYAAGKVDLGADTGAEAVFTNLTISQPT